MKSSGPDRRDGPMGSGEDPREFKSRLLWFGVPMVLAGLLSVPFSSGESPLVLLWFLGPLVALAALVAIPFYYITRRPWSGTGALAALAVGALVLTVTCFANLRQVPI